MKPLELYTKKEDAGKRLDQLLSQACPDISRSALQKAIAGGLCSIDGIPAQYRAQKLRAGQQIFLEALPEDNALTPETGKLEIIWEDSELLVCAKPPGLTVHPCPSCPENTLIQRVLAHYPKLAKQGGLRPGIVHRLDKDTSGLMLIALTESMRLKLCAAFAMREIHKEYLALVSGLTPEEGLCIEPIGRHPTQKIKMAIVPENRGGKSAHTSWRRLWHSRDKSFSLLALKIQSGRTHQIRVHLANLGYPILGDALYAPAGIKALAPRQMLHAWKLSFQHPQNVQNLEFCLPPPEDFLSSAIQCSIKPKRIIVTGNPGSGKSAFCRELETLGLPVTSADALVEKLYAPKGEARKWLLKRFGAEILAPDGAVDKKALLELMQESNDLREEVDALVHPMVRDKLEEFWARQEKSATIAAVAEIPLYFESGGQNCEDQVLIVGIDCPKAERWQRIRTKRNWNETKIAEIESWQWPEERKMKACQLVISNIGNTEALKQAAESFLGRIIKERNEQIAHLDAFFARLWSCTNKGSG